MPKSGRCRKPLVAAYVYQREGINERALYRDLGQLPIGGFEVALHAEGAQPSYVLRHPEELESEATCVITCIPVVMGRLLPARKYGLSAPDDDARLPAVADVLRAIESARDAADKAGRPVVGAIEIHSSPGPSRGSRDSMARSLETLLSEDDAPLLVIEHCDAEIPGREPSKGFWSLDDEIAMVDEFRSTSSERERIGIGLNWGRSAIEGHGAQLALEHVQHAEESGLLRTLIFSGATGDATLWGEPWGDMHIPPHGEDPRFSVSSSSLMGADEISQAVNAAGPDVLLGLKVAVRPETASLAERVSLAASTVTLINNAIQARDPA